MNNKELTMIMMSCFLEKKVSIKNIMEVFDLTEDEAKLAVEELIKKDAIYNYNFSKKEMKYISKKELEDIIKNTGKSKSELFNEYCVYNENMSIDGSLQEKCTQPLNEKTKIEILKIAIDVGIISGPIIQRVLYLGLGRVFIYLDWLKEHNYIDNNKPEHNVLISRDDFIRLYPIEKINNIPFNLFKAFDTKERYKKFIELFNSNKELENKFYQNIKLVKYDDIISLCKENFNIIPSSWLYDWEKITGCNDFTQIEKMIKKRKEEGIDI